MFQNLEYYLINFFYHNQSHQQIIEHTINQWKHKFNLLFCQQMDQNFQKSRCLYLVVFLILEIHKNQDISYK